MSSEREPGFATLAIHAGTKPDPLTGARTMPVHQSSLLAFTTVDQARDVFTLNGLGALHTETANPTISALEERIAALEGGTAAVATASGASAILHALGVLLEPGDEFITSSRISGTTFNQFESSFRNYGWHPVWVDTEIPGAIEEALTPRTKAIFIESFTNPSGSLTDISAVAGIAHHAGIPLIVDNTLATPYLIKPLQHGADIVVYAATAFLGGHGLAHGGVIVDGGNFDWATSTRFPKLTEPRPEYDGLVFHETFGNFAYAMAVRALGLRDSGAFLSPTNAFLILSGLETLPLRMQKHVENSAVIADYLSNHKHVAWVNYAGLSTSLYRRRVQQYSPQGAGAVFTFGLTGGDEAALSFVESVQLMTHSAHVGNTRSTVLHPSSTTHAHMATGHKTSLKAGGDAIRISVGLEDVNDLIADIEQAIADSMV